MTMQVPELTTKETQRLRLSYPSIEHLEAGHAASWLQERHDQLIVKAQKSRAEMNLSKLVTLAGTVVGVVCYATSPLATIGAIVSAVGYVWSIGLDLNDSHRFAPIPFVRDNILEFISAMGDAEAREDWLIQRNEIADLMFHLNLLERYEFAMLREFHSVLSEYLDQVEPGKRFYAYRWLSDRFVDYKGAIPDKNSLNKHLETVTADPRINYQAVTAIQERRSPKELSQTSPRVFELPQPRTVSLITGEQESSKAEGRGQEAGGEQVSSPPVIVEGIGGVVVNTPHAPIPQPSQPSKPQSKFPDLQTVLKLSLLMRAQFITRTLVNSGFKIDEVMSSQVIAIASSQRGGKGTLAAILVVLSKAFDQNPTIEYFTAGIDIYPFACNLHSGLSYPSKTTEQADKQVALDLLQFLKKLESAEPYSHKNLLLIIDEAMRLLSLLEAEDRAWAIAFLLSRFAKTGATLIIVLHATNLSSVAGKDTAGLAATFKEGVEFIGCNAVAVDAGGLRKINVASGSYFKADPRNFGKSLKGGELGSIPEWLKTEKHPGNGHPDPARTLLKFFPELAQDHTPKDALLPEERGELNRAIQSVEQQKFTIFNVDALEAQKLINDLKGRGYEQSQIISMLWQVQLDSEDWAQAQKQYEILSNQQD